MGISLANLVENRREVVITFEGGDLHVSYNPSKLNAGFVSRLQEQLDDDDPLAFARLFCSVVTAWDLVGPLGEGETAVADGEAVPLSPEHVAWVPGFILKHVIERISEDAAPKQKTSSRR